MRTYVLGFFFSENREKVALIMKKRPDWQAGFMNGIGGKIEKGESPLRAMIREFREETGHTHEDWQYVGNMNNPDFTVYVYRAFGDVTKLKSTTDEEVKVIDVMLLNISKVLYNINWWIPLALDNAIEPVTINYQHDKEDGRQN